ncbi:NAC domain-containing protein 53-like isoform X2 [Diospyros lotus]|uniref:NAC domain-containing protein 53-like isoform X2 n=1 Tax=Diospyros lotus TaxID=55363 RepID=UPI00225AB71A|nr:NAC domain-containing protein 53-like isoform X2 [Diospyros lotus]
MARNSLCPGLRFHPTDVELVMYFLKKKVMGKKFRFEAISELNVYKYSPWDLPDKSLLGSKDLEWYFFCPKERKYSIGARTNRLTETGFWKSTGNDRAIFHKERTVGMVKTLVFHKGRTLKGERTNWVMYEYRIVDKEVADAGFLMDSYVICKVFQKSGLGPKNGAQYGAPFNEEDWDDDDEISANPSPHDVLPLPAVHDNSNSVVTGMFAPESGPSQVLPLAYEVAPPIADNGEDINFLLDMFKDDSSLPPDQNEDSKMDVEIRRLPS